LPSTPADGAGNSTVALAESSITTVSSAATLSPSFLSHSPISTSLMDSPTRGTFSSIAILSLFNHSINTPGNVVSSLIADIAWVEGVASPHGFPALRSTSYHPSCFTGTRRVPVVLCCN
jgi:hypothetical protein